MDAQRLFWLKFSFDVFSIENKWDVVVDFFIINERYHDLRLKFIDLSFEVKKFWLMVGTKNGLNIIRIFVLWCFLWRS